MHPRLTELAKSYDASYRRGVHFNYRTWLFRPFVKAMVAKARLPQGASVLDAGCGQGYFSGLLASLGMRTLGVDISMEAIRAAQSMYSFRGASFEVGDVSALPYEGRFDCVFVRGCSLYNTAQFSTDVAPTETFLRYAKRGGLVIFDYYTNFGGKKVSQSWRYHKVAEAHHHFCRYPGASVYFSLRIETIPLGRFAFTRAVTPIAEQVSKLTGVGGDLVAFVRNQ